MLDRFSNVKYSVFFDLYENSMMDILIVRGSSFEISTIYNNFAKDAFYLKSRFISDPSLGTSAPSVSIRCVLTDLKDNKFIVMATQTG